MLPSCIFMIRATNERLLILKKVNSFESIEGELVSLSFIRETTLLIGILGQGIIVFNYESETVLDYFKIDDTKLLLFHISLIAIDGFDGKRSSNDG